MQTYRNTLDAYKRYSQIFPYQTICLEYLVNIDSMLDGYSHSYILSYLKRNLGSDFHPDIGKVLNWIKFNKGETGLFRNRIIADLISSLERCPFIQPEDLPYEDLHVLVEFSEFTYGKF